MTKRVRDSIRELIEDLHAGYVAAGPPAGDAGDVPRRLAALGFTEGESAQRLTSLCHRLFAAELGDGPTVDLVDVCRRSPSPDAALLNLDRFLERVASPGVFVGTALAAPPVLEMVATVFGASQYMADIIVRNPGTVYWLMEGAQWEDDDTAEDLAARFREETAVFQGTPARLDAIRRAHRQALLKIGILDVVHRHAVEEIARRLSDLAQATVEVTLGVVLDDLGAPPPGDGNGMAVIALGKLGGRELNYSSDIDLVYACEDADDDTVARYTKVARRLTDALSELTAEGYLYRVDLRLRPDGRSGPLVNSETALRLYYENRGRPWEFQALLKARPIAGNIALGDRLLDALGRMTFSRSLSYSPLEDIARMRARIQENVPERERGFNIKLAEGGIRDVEFVAQSLQLTHGQRHPEMRTPNTLAAFSHIRRLGLLQTWEVDNLENAYRFLRVVEHRLQMMHQIKTHTVPRSREELALLARRISCGPVGAFTADSFLGALSLHLNNVRTFAASFFAGEGVHPYSVLLMLPEDDERAVAIIKQYGVRDVRRVVRTLHAMAYGSFPRLLDRGTRVAFESLLPHLLEGAARTGDPEQTIVNVARIADAGRSEASLYRLMSESEGARRIILGVAGFSSYLAQRLCSRIGELDGLLADPSAGVAAEPLRPAETFRYDVARAGGAEADALRATQRAGADRRRLHELVTNLRAGFRAPLNGTRERSEFARRHLAAAFDSAVGGGRRVALFALGSHAVGEPRLFSDVDVLVVSDHEDAADVTARIQTVNRWYTDGGLLKLDFRLRGEGASAPLVQDLSFYDGYFARRLSLWERVAFAKCAAWWGEAGLREAFTTRVRNAVFRPFTREEITELVAMRKRVESLAPKKFRTWETKRSAGGRYDVEYFTAIALASGVVDADLLGAPTHDRIDRTRAVGVISKAGADACHRALEVFSLVEYLMELQELSLPRSAARSADLARYLDRCFEHLGIPAPNGVSSLLDAAKADVRRVYQHAIDRCL